METNLNKVFEVQKNDPGYVGEPPQDQEGSHATYAPSQASASWPPKPTPTKSTPKALSTVRDHTTASWPPTLKATPTVRDHTTDQLGPGGDEYLPREIDDAGEKKVMHNGVLHGGREYRCRTFLVPNRGDKLFMLATECARVLGYRDSYLLFNKNRSLFKIIANQTEKDDLVNQEILPFSYRSRQIAIVTARSMFRQFGSRMIVNGRRVRDDYWESKARKQGFTEADLAGEKRPDASRAREEAAAVERNVSHLGGQLVEIHDTTRVPPWLVPDDQSATPYAAKEQPPRIVYSGEASLLEGQGSDDQRAPRLKGRPLREYQNHPSRVEEQSSPDSPLQVFVHALARWRSAETVGAQLQLLEDLGTRRPTNLPEAIGIGSKFRGWLRCEWELPSVVRELRESQSSEVQPLLENFVTITGSHGNIECATCAQFLEKEWKEVGARALKVLCRGVSLLENVSTKPGESPNSTQNASIHATEARVVIEVDEQRDAQSFIDAIVWICAAVRVNPQKQSDTGKRCKLQLSKANQLLFIENAQPQALVYGLEELTECSDQQLEPETRCWTGLFHSGIIACRPIERQWGAGLEIPFDMLLDLSGVENVYQIEGGIILVGFFTALVPISRDDATNSIQWHFEEIDGSSGELLKPYALPSMLRDWYKSRDINVLRSSKCFVGWFARASILLGTRQLIENSRNKLKWSTDTKEHRQSARREGFEASGQLGFTAGPINTGLQLISTWRFHSNVQHFHRHEQYSMALRLGRGNVAVVIDSESKQVWLVPMLSLVLHLCHRYFQEVCSAHADNPLPFADPSPDGASEAARVLECNGEVLVFGSAGDPDAENLRQLFLRINTNLLNSAATREPSNKKKLFASELMAMVTEPGRGSPLKEMKAPADAESWVGLLERVDFVGVCANIGYLIEPERPSANNCACSALPCNKYLLAAHIRCLDALAQREGCTIGHSLNRVCRLGESAFWNMENVYWTNCPAGGHDTIWNDKDKILQQISNKEKGKGKNVPRLNGQVMLQQHLPEDGVVVFGGDTTKRVLQSFYWN